jgi:thiamine-monophosphate kinase
LTKFEVQQPSTFKSIGDDAAVLDFKDKKVVVSTDLLIEGVHFDLAYMPLKHLGYKGSCKCVRYLRNECKGDSNHSL